MPLTRPVGVAVADIETHDLSRRFGGIPALRRVNLSVRQGTIFGLMGNNGAGKTTAIHCLLGLIPPSRGSIRMLGYDPTRQRVELLRQVGFFPERDAPYEWMRLHTFFAVGRHAYRDWDDPFCHTLCDHFSLDTRKKIKDLSKGMLAKAKLIFALSHRPRCLMLDEPTSGLDPGSRDELLSLVAELAREQGVTTLLSSHYLDDIEGIATEVGVLHQGRLIFTSPMDRASDGFELIEIDASADAQLDRLAEMSALVRQTDGRMQCLAPQKDADEFEDHLKRLPAGAVTRRRVSLRELFRMVTTGQGLA